MEEHAAFTAEPANFLERLKRTHFIIRAHNADEDRPAGEGALQLRQINKTIRTDRKVRHLPAELFKMPAAIQYGFVLNGGSNDVIALVAIHLGHALDGQVVAFRGAAGKHNLTRRCTDQAGNLLRSE